jgi:hypothetical protein
MMMVEACAHGRNGEIMVLMLRPVEAHSQIASIIIIDIRDSGNALIAGWAGIIAGQRFAHQIAHGL